ncbi:MAG: DUF6702 family protein [Steroidobacteraceae bacterium]
MPGFVQRRWLLSALALGTIGGLGPRIALAHRSHVTLTRLSANPGTMRWELSHSIHFHDAAVALRRLAPGKGLQPVDAAGQARLMLEIEQRFLWTTPSGKRLQPQAVGAELQGDGLVLYQECEAPGETGSYAVECRFLHDVFDSQTNTISIELVDPPMRRQLKAATPMARFEVGALGG